ncbi:hypothetical protein KCU76_g104, partial [Aureobasidium melanogenum]
MSSFRCLSILLFLLASLILCHNLLNHSNTVLLADQYLLLFQGLLDGLGSFKDIVEFLELSYSAILGLREPIPDDDGQANWLSRPPALTAKLENAIPLARISKDNSAEHEDHGDCSFGGTCVCRVVEDAAGSGHADPDDCATNHAGEHQAASANLVDECRSRKSKHELEACVAQVDIGLLNSLVVASSVQHRRDEVR